MKKIASVFLTAAMAASLVGCGGGSSAKPSGSASNGSDEGKVLNIQCWNDEFKSRMVDHYPGYEKIDDNTGKIGDVTIKFTSTPSENNAYQDNLDTILPGNEDANPDDKVDLFLFEADYATKYVNSDRTMNVKDLGITDADLSDMYQYTKDIASDTNGNLKGLSWQACSAGMIYNREAAKEILGTDDPAEVQAAVSDWDKYNEVAAKAKEKGYLMTASENDTYRVYSNNVSGPWVKDGKIVIDPNIKAWVDASKAAVDAGETTTHELWSADWSSGFYPDGKVFCYFGPAWLINFCMKADEAGSIANQGGWAFCEGPQSFYWGGSWIAAATGTDNPTLVKDIMLTMTTNKDVLKEIVEKDSDCVNSKAVLTELASDKDFGLAVLGGQNPYENLAKGAEHIDMSNISNYDQGCNEEFQKAMKGYFDGNYATYDDALAAFDKAVKEKYPDLK